MEKPMNDTPTLNIVCPHCNAVNRVVRERTADQPTCGACRAALFGGHPVALDATAFNRHLSRSDLPLVVDFWAPWCAPCRMMAPVFERIAARLEPYARFAKVNTDEEQQLAASYNIRSIPTLAVFKNGREAARTAGAMDESSLLAWLHQSL
jgi:thioredoxin 2